MKLSKVGKILTSKLLKIAILIDLLILLFLLSPLLFGYSYLEILKGSTTWARYAIGPILGVLLAFILSVIKDRFEEKREIKKSLNIILVDLKCNLNILRSFRNSVKPLDNDAFRFFYLRSIGNFFIPDKTITASIASVLEDLSDEDLAPKLLTSQQSYIGFSHSLNKRDKVYMDIMHNHNIPPNKNLDLGELIELVGYRKLCHLYVLTENVISSYNDTYKIMRESYIDVSMKYKELGFGDILLLRQTKSQSIKIKIPLPKIKKSEDLLELLEKHQKLNEKSDYVQKW